MRSKKPFVLLCLLLGLMGTGPLHAAEKPADANVVLRTLGSQTVLYTIVRGPYDKLGEAFGSLYSVLAGKGLKPAGPAMSVTLTNPEATSSEHWLTEIRIPVDDSAKKLAGTLGPMTDIKTVSETKVVVATKPKGVSDPADIIRRMYTWMAQNGYMPTGGPWQKVSSDSQNYDYGQSIVEIMVPVMKAPSTAK